MTQIKKNYPMKYGNLFPGTLFTIVAEPSRRIFKSKDKATYRRALDGFYSTNVETGDGCILLPGDIVLRVLNQPRNKQ